MVREVASKTSDVAGDGTTTATVLAQHIVDEGLKNVTAGANPMSIKRGIDAARDQVVEAIKVNQKIFQIQNKLLKLQQYQRMMIRKLVIRLLRLWRK